MTQKRVADEVLGGFARFQQDVFERVRKGSLDPDTVVKAIQRVLKPQAQAEKQLVYRVPVNYDDPRFHGPFHKNNYSDINQLLKPEHFPIKKKGRAVVTMGYLTFNRERTPKQTLDWCFWSPGLGHPDRAEVESFFDQNPEETTKYYPVIGLCGSTVKHGDTDEIAYVSAYKATRRLGFCKLDGTGFTPDCRFLIVGPTE